jgi:diguanylate cyclase
MNLNEIAKETLLKFKNRGYIFTPKEYEEEFCKTAKKHKVIIEDCNKISKYISKLNKKYQIIAKNYNIKNLDDLILFLIHHLNRENPQKDKENLEELFLYTKRALDVIIILPFLKSRKIALKHLNYLKPNLSKEEFFRLRNEWIEFLDSFDDKIIKKAKQISDAKTEDAIEIIQKLLEKLEETPTNELLIDSIIYTLTPSYAPFMNDEVAILKKQIKENPSFILSKAFAEDLKILTDKRIKLDKEELKKKIKDLDQIAERLSIKILRILKKTDDSSNEIKNITIEIKNWRKDDKEDFETIKEKLLNIANSIDKELNNFSNDIKKEDDEIKKLKEKIKYLEGKVKKLSQEVKTDHLTNIANKKALEEELKKQESAYKRYNTIYSIAFFDIDHFKNVNDTYGHDAGDVILKSLGLLFRRYVRDVDTIGRFGGEEFIAILPHTDKKGAYAFAEKIRKIVENTKFIYKNTRIPITISGGVAERAEVNSKEEVLKKADERLFLAKKYGRNRVCAEDKCE